MRLHRVLSLAAFSAAVAVGHAQQPARQVQPSPYPQSLYRMNDVAKSLNLTDEQAKRLNALTDKVQGTYANQYEKLGTVPEADRFARSQELNRRYQNDWMAGAREVFKENQLNRYQQLQYQYGGFGTLTDPEVQKRLALNEEQRKALGESVQWSTQQMNDIYRQGGSDRERAAQLYGDYQKQYQARFGKYLTPEQQKTWREMTGDPYRFQPVYTAPQR